MNKLLLYLGMFVFISSGCKKSDSSSGDTGSKIPVVKTLNVCRVGYTMATCQVYSEMNIDSTIVETGACWSVTNMPTLNDQHSNLNSRIGSTSSILLNNLSENTKFHVRGYATNLNGITAYGDTLSFTTLEKKPVIILFQQDFFNDAWSYIHSGFFIDNSGKVRGYNMVHPAWDPVIRNELAYYDTIAHNDTIEKNDLESSYFLTDTLYGEVNLDTLVIMKSYIGGLLSSHTTNSSSSCDDYGENSFFAYNLDSVHNSYGSIFIEEFGDRCKRNKNANAQEIGNWLTRISKKYYPYFGTSCNCNYH
jgi:hypothetical protein